VRKQRPEGKGIVVAYQSKSIDVSKVEILCDKKKEVIGHILERGHDGEIL
jgi:hypothetical protein